MGPTRPICSILTFIGEQEQLKKLSDNFGLSKQNKLYLVRDCWLWLKRYKEQRKLSVKYKCVVCVFVYVCLFQFWNIEDDV